MLHVHQHGVVPVRVFMIDKVLSPTFLFFEGWLICAKLAGT